MIAAISRNKTGFNLPGKRIVKHIAFWALYYGFLLLYYWNINITGHAYILNAQGKVFQLCLALLADSIFLYYSVVQIVVPVFKKHMLSGIALTLLVIFCTYYLNYFLLTHLLYNEPSTYKSPYYSRELFSTENLYFFCNITIYLTFTAITLKLAKTTYTASKKTLLLSKLRNDIEVEFLKSQIKPHFLFNALNSIYGIALNDEEAINILLDFSKLLRYLLYNSEEHVHVEEETDIIRIFANIHQQINPAVHITLHFGNIPTTRIKKYDLFTQVQLLFADTATPNGAYALTQENDRLYFKQINE